VATSTISPLLVIVGETASGKSDLAIKLARQFNGEIICADSWTVRRDMDIGSAKPSTIDRDLVPHHLLDVVAPNEDFTAAVFKRLANEAIQEIMERKKLPILVGGTGLYVDGVIYDFGFLPQGNQVSRERLNGLSLSQLLAEVNGMNINIVGIDLRNKRRLIRLIETKGARPTKQKLRQNTIIIGLRTEYDLLSDRITKRVDKMLASGLESEVQALADQYGWDCEGLKGIGYAQWKDYFNGTQTLAETREKIIKATKDFTKRQRTWFKRNKSIQWIDTPVNWQNLVDLLTTTLYK
jgi:tRNA dimethylallyltransferase